MPDNTAPQQPVLVPGEVRLCSVSFDDVLDSGESLTGVVTCAEQTTTDLTFANQAVSAASLTINNKTVTAGRAVQFMVSGQLVANSPYVVLITVSTDSTPAQTLKKCIKFQVATE